MEMIDELAKALITQSTWPFALICAAIAFALAISNMVRTIQRGHDKRSSRQHEVTMFEKRFIEGKRVMGPPPPARDD